MEPDVARRACQLAGQQVQAIDVSCALSGAVKAYSARAPSSTGFVGIDVSLDAGSTSLLGSAIAEYRSEFDIVEWALPAFW
jgi:hypothetical protein